jgi:hypothetical protein
MSSYEYHQILQFLYFEGYADSYEEAEELVESLSDDEISGLCERATRPTRFPKSRERNIGHDDWKDSDPDNRDWNERPPAAKKLRSRLNAVVGTQKRQDIETGVRKEELNYDEFEELNEARRKLAHSFPLKPSERRSADNIERMNRGDFSVPPGGSVRVRSSRKNEPEPEEKKPKGRRIRTDMSKVIVAHYLFDEGYADSLDGAEVMAESISDNWVNEILDEKYVKEMNPKGDDRRARTTDPTIRPSRLKKMPDVIKQTESGFDKTASRRSPGARRRKDERRQGTGGFGA